MALPEFTTIVGVDREHLPELAAAWPTWVKWRPEILENPILFVVDNGINGGIPVYDIDAAVGLSLSKINFRAVGCTLPNAWPQRERMLTALVACVEHVKTPYYLKLDTDTVAVGTGPDGRWWEDGWFEGGEGGRPVIIASPWGYTKPFGYLDACDEWWEFSMGFNAEESHRPPRTITGSIAKHPRIISYAMWGRTDWTQTMWEMCNGRLPCPSQDTFLWYCADRGGWPIIRANQKRYGWQHCGSSLKRIRERAAIALNA